MVSVDVKHHVYFFTFQGWPGEGGVGHYGLCVPGSSQRATVEVGGLGKRGGGQAEDLMACSCPLVDESDRTARRMGLALDTRPRFIIV